MFSSKGQSLSSCRCPYSLFKAVLFAKISRDNTKLAGVAVILHIFINQDREQAWCGLTGLRFTEKHQSPKTQGWGNSSIGKEHILLV